MRERRKVMDDIAAEQPLLECTEDNTDHLYPRVLLVHGFRRDSFGQGLERFLREYVVSCTLSAPLGSDDSVSARQQLVRVVVERNIHRHVRSCRLVFRTHNEASVFLLQSYHHNHNRESPECVKKDVSERQGCVFEEERLWFDYGAGRLRDHFFPGVPFPLRRQLRITDGEAMFSVTDEVWSLRTASLLRIFVGHAAIGAQHHLPQKHPSNDEQKATRYVAVDGTACVGGNTFGLARRFDGVFAVERDAARLADLQHNIGVLSLAPAASNGPAAAGLPSTEQVFWQPLPQNAVTVIHGDIASEEVLRLITPQASCVLLDPPWGGPQYPELLKAFDGDLPCDWQVGSTASKATAAHTTLLPIILDLCGFRVPNSEDMTVSNSNLRSLAPVVAWKLPSGFDLTRCAKALTSRSLVEGDACVGERCFPFRFAIGAHTVLFVVCVVARSRRFPDGMADGGPLWFCNKMLDELVAALASWNATVGCHEHRPEFFDYEKNRWILLKKWIPESARQQQHPLRHVVN